MENCSPCRKWHLRVHNWHVHHSTCSPVVGGCYDPFQSWSPLSCLNRFEHLNNRKLSDLSISLNIWTTETKIDLSEHRKGIQRTTKMEMETPLVHQSLNHWVYPLVKVCSSLWKITMLLISKSTKQRFLWPFWRANSKPVNYQKVSWK